VGAANISYLGSCFRLFWPKKEFELAKIIRLVWRDPRDCLRSRCIYQMTRRIVFFVGRVLCGPRYFGGCLFFGVCVIFQRFSVGV